MYHLIVFAASYLGFVFIAETLNPFPLGRYHPKKHGIHARKKKLGMLCALIVLTVGVVTPFIVPAETLINKLIFALVLAVLFCMPTVWAVRRFSS